MSKKKYTVKQLQYKLKTLGLTNYSKLKKQELLELLENHEEKDNNKEPDICDPKSVSIKAGIHVFKNGNMAESIIDTRCKLGINAVQIFTHGPRTLVPIKMDYQAVAKACSGINLYVHSAYPTNPWRGTEDAINGTIEQFKVSYILGSLGVILHIPKLDPPAVVKPIPDLVKALHTYKIMDGQKVILEMKALKSHPTMSYESPAKINRLIKLLKFNKLKPTEVGICIDTAHIYAGNAQIMSYDDAVDYCNAIEYPEWICLLHLNGNEYDAKKRAGDKHAIPLDGHDKIWNKLKYNTSGCKAFIQYAHKLNIDIIIEAKAHHSREQILTFLAVAKSDLAVAKSDLGI